jgi:hypothetical protein
MVTEIDAPACRCGAAGGTLRAEGSTMDDATEREFFDETMGIPHEEGRRLDEAAARLLVDFLGGGREGRERVTQALADMPRFESVLVAIRMADDLYERGDHVARRDLLDALEVSAWRDRSPREGDSDAGSGGHAGGGPRAGGTKNPPGGPRAI